MTEQFNNPPHLDDDKLNVAAALARAMRIHRHGLIRPLWEDMTPTMRDALTNNADQIIKTLNRHGLDVIQIGRKIS